MLNRTLGICTLIGLLGLPTWTSAEYRIETVASGLDHPWSMAWLPDGRLLVTERSGRLRLIENGELLTQPVTGVPEAHVNSQAGLFEVLPAEDFAASGTLYLSLARGEAGANTLVVVRGVLADGQLQQVEEIFRHTPLRSTSVHYGGRMQFLPDGTLLVTLGDGFDYREQAQNTASHFGSIVRLNPDGTVPEDNPLANSLANSLANPPAGLPHIYSYGLRNPQGLALDTTTGTLWATDHGPRGGDELNRIRAGANYGWPATTHGVDYTGAVISPYQELPGMEPPLLVWTPAIAPGGMTVYQGERFAQWQGDLLIAGLVSRAVHRVRVQADGKVREEERLFEELNRRIRQVRTGPDGALYLLTDHPDGQVLRVE